SALALIALVAFATVSLACLDVGRVPNLGGPVGERLAYALGAVLGYQAYAALALGVALASRVWTRTRLLTLARGALGGAIVLAALATAGGLFDPSGLRIGGRLGAWVAGVLTASLNVAGGYLVAVLAMACGLALMLKRAPTELVAAAWAKMRAGLVRPRTGLEDEFPGLARNFQRGSW